MQPPDPAKNYVPGDISDELTVLPSGVKVKRRMLRMRACTEKDPKGKMCRGHIKRWFTPDAEVTTIAGGDEVYRCERCKTIYLPNPAEPARTQTLAW